MLPMLIFELGKAVLTMKGTSRRGRDECVEPPPRHSKQPALPDLVACLTATVRHSVTSQPLRHRFGGFINVQMTIQSATASHLSYVEICVCMARVIRLLTF